MKITVILCTYNRCQSLAKALESAAALKLPEADEWEILVVDNNSTDKTREVVESFCGQYPGRFRYLFEPRQGLSYARNAGIREALGDIVAFADDDVTVEPTWLQHLIAPLRSGAWAGSGGRILAQRTFASPRWLPLETRYALAPLALFDLGPEAGKLTESPFGNNMAFRKDMFEKYGGFRTELGRCGESLISGEDSEFGTRLLNAGERLRYEPSAIVYHAIPECRLHKNYFLTWWFDKARADIRAFGIPAETKWRLGGIPLVFLRRLTVWTLRWLVAVKPSRRFSCKLKVWTVAGQIMECYRQSLGAKRQTEEESSQHSPISIQPKP
jgi:glycosyltransferase involved in cell wall biosynthesis